MPIISEGRTTVHPTLVDTYGSTVYNPGSSLPPVTYEHPGTTLTGATLRTESQVGHRTDPGSGKTREPGLPPTVEKWSDGPKLVQYLDALDRATSTSPRGARGNFAVNQRDYTRSVAGSRVLSIPLSYTYTEGVRSWDWSANAGVKVQLASPPPLFAARASDPDFSKALRDMRPTKSHAELATFVGELGDSPRTVSTLLANLKAQRLSEGPINYMFGVAPAIADIKSLAKAVSSSAHITDRFVEHSGRSLRRSRSWEDEPVYTTATFPVNVYAPKRSTPSISFSAQVYLERRIRRFYKAGATYQYYTADPTGFLSRAKRYRQMADHLLGTNFDASTLWELTPWSWLVDWSVDIGGLISYQEDVVDDSLVLRGGYSSVFDEIHDTYRVHVKSNRDTNLSFSTSTPQVFGFEETVLFKHRRRLAGPYAWSLNNEVTPRRSAILAALGLSRAA